MFIAVFIGFLSLKYLKQDIKTITHSQHAIEQWEEYEKEFLTLSEIVYFPCLNLQSINPFKIKDIECKPVAFGWFSLSPLNNDYLFSHRDFVQHGIWIVQPHQTPPTHLQMSIERNYGIKTEPVVCYKNAEYTAYKLVQINLTEL